MGGASQVRGAGHMVPRYRPREIFVAINTFFSGEILPGYSKHGGARPSPLDARCRVAADPSVVRTHSTGGHDSWMPQAGGVGGYVRVNGTYCGPHSRSVKSNAWVFTGDVDMKACLAECKKVQCTCFDTK
jgi:hypothetical protein